MVNAMNMMCPESLTVQLTETEIMILQAIADGLKTDEIGERYFMAASTIKAHLRSIFSKLNAKHRTHAVAIALRQGWIK